MSILYIKLNSFRHRKKIAAFDYDFTLVKPKDNKTFPKTIDDWEWLRPNVIEILQDFYKKKYCIMLFTNQTKQWKADQIKMVMELVKIPVMICVAFDKTLHKPNPKMFNDIVTKPWDKEKSFFVGDALGRNADWSNTDKLFANAIGIKIQTPETIFPLNVALVQKQTI